MLTALEPTRSLGPRHSIDAAFHAYHTRSPRAKHKQNISMQRLIHSRLCAPARPTRSPNMPRPSARIATTPLPRRPTAPLECLQTAQQAALKQRSSEPHNGLGWWIGRVCEGRGRQDWSGLASKGRKGLRSGVRAGSIPSGAHRNLCAPLGSGSSQLEHLDLEPVPVEKAEMRRRSSRRSHHLHSKRAHDRGFREPNAAARSIGARWAVTSAVRGEGAHVLEQICHVLG